MRRPYDTASANLVAVLMASVVCFILALCTLIFIAVPDGANTASIIAILIGQIPPSLIGIAALIKANKVDKTANRIAGYPFEREVREALSNILETHLDDSVLDKDRPNGNGTPRIGKRGH